MLRRIALAFALALTPRSPRRSRSPSASPPTSLDRPALSRHRPEPERRRARLRYADPPRPAAEARSRPRDVVEARRRHDLGDQAAPRRAVPRRHAAHARRRAVLVRAAGDDPQLAVAVHRLHQGHRVGAGGRRDDHPREDQRPVSAAAQRSLGGAHRLEARRDGCVDRGLQQRQGDHRHRAVSLRALGQGRPHRTRAQRCLLGTEAAVGEGDAAPDPRRSRRASRRCSPATCRRSTPCPPRSRQAAVESGRPARAGDLLPPDLPASRRRARPLAVHHRQGGQAARPQSAEGRARAPRDLQGDQPRR